MLSFGIKKLDVSLFGVVESPNQAPWHQSFAAASSIEQLAIDEGVLEIVAAGLEMDADGFVLDAKRYVAGEYRSKAKGLSGGRLGDVGEVLTYLVNQAEGREIIRVVGWRKDVQQPLKGSKFPQPDFLINEQHGLAALEVKSTEALDFIDLRDSVKTWKWLKPCAAVAGCRNEALPQLGYVGAVLTPQKHQLLLMDGKVVPFPVGKGVATTVAAVDGRAHALRQHNKYKTPPACRDAKRNCWACIKPTCHFVIVRMPNAPQMLSMAGPMGDGAKEWFRAYRRWGQALAVRDVLAARSTLRDLIQAVSFWLDAFTSQTPTKVESAGLVRAFWGFHLADAMASRGLIAEGIEALAGVGRVQPNLRWTAAGLAEPVAREVAMQQLTGFLRDSHGTPRLASASARLNEGSQTDGSVTVRVDSESVEFHVLAEAWWKDRGLEGTDEASTIARELLFVALRSSGWQGDPGPVDVRLREAAVQLGDERRIMGWVLDQANIRLTSSFQWAVACALGMKEGRGALCHRWLISLEIGDPRARLVVTREGHGMLRLPQFG